MLAVKVGICSYRRGVARTIGEKLYSHNEHPARRQSARGSSFLAVNLALRKIPFLLSQRAYQPVTCCVPPFPAQFAPMCHGQQFPKTIQEYDVQHTRVHTDRSHKRQPVAVMSLRALPCTLATSPVCPISAFAPLEYDHDRTQ
jgi:hypothetical protein